MNESTNFGLKTTQDTDQWRNTLDYHNENMGVIDAVLANNQNALGIIVDGNKAAVSATAGQYIILRNSTITGKTDGLYTAAKSIPANTAIDGTYLTAVSGGGLNALNGKIDNLIKKKILSSGAITIPAGTVGTRGYQTSVALSLPTGSTILGYYINNISYSSDDICQIFIYDGSLYFNFYRCISTQHTNSIDACVVYI